MLIIKSKSIKKGGDGVNIGLKVFKGFGWNIGSICYKEIVIFLGEFEINYRFLNFNCYFCIEFFII